MNYQPFPSFTDWNVQLNASVIEQYANKLRQAKEAATPEAQRRALEIATRYAAVDTGALEGLYTTDRGFTRTIATQSELWQNALALKGEQVKRSIEDALSGYDYVLDTATKTTPITQVWIRELHSVLTAHQETYKVFVSIKDHLHEEHRPLPHGDYKQLPNNPTNASTGTEHHYAPPEITQAEMMRFTDELKSEAFQEAHSVIQAAYAHYAYVCIHPFVDGNGRVARALASVYLYRSPGVPLVVFADQRDTYLDALAAADGGRPQAFVQFISERVIDTIGLVEQSLVFDGTESMKALQHLREASIQEPSQELLLAAERLREIVIDSLNVYFTDSNLPKWVEWAVNHYVSLSEYLPIGYSIAGTNSGFDLNGRKAPNTSERLWWPYSIGVAQTENLPELVVTPNNGGVTLDVWLREISPSATTALKLKVDAWARGTVDHFVCELAKPDSSK